MSEMDTSNAQLSPKLLLDVLLCIIDTVASLGDLDTLKSFSVVHSTLRPLCARHIFATIKITNFVKENYSAFNQLKTLLEENPGLVKYMKHLDLWIQEWDWENPNIPVVLNQLQDVKTLKLNTFTDLESTIGWEAIPQPLRIALERHICSPSLIRLEIKSISNFPVPSILANSPSLKLLDLCSSVTVMPSNVLPIIVPKHAPVPQLDLLFIDFICSLEAARLILETKRPDGRPAIDLSAVKFTRLMLNHTATHTSMLRKYLGFFPGLQVLGLIVSGIDTFNFVEYVHPSSLKTIRSLILSLMTSIHDHRDPYRGLCEELKVLAAAKCPLKRLKLTLHLNIAVNVENTIETDSWNKLDDVLNLSNFPALHHVTLLIRTAIHGGASDVPERLRQTGQNFFPNLTHEPSITFIFFVEEARDD